VTAASLDRGGSISVGSGVARRSDASRSALSRLHPSVREEVERLIAKLGGIVRVSVDVCGRVVVPWLQ